MDIAFEQENWLVAPAWTGERSDCAHPEWHGLRARLVASSQARRALDQANCGNTASVCGSFDRPTARMLSALGQDAGPVNLTDSVNRNRGGDMHGAVAGMSSTGGRG